MPLYELRDNRLSEISIKKFNEEETLQELILNNPQIIFDPIGIDSVDDVVFRGKELGVDGKSIDIVFLTRKGSVYIVETKLYKNSKHREAVAQVLEYGALMYKEANSNIERLMEKFGLNTEEDDFLDVLKENLEEGNYNLIVVMDKIPNELKYIIELLNTTNGISLYALQIAELKKPKDTSPELLEIELYGAIQRHSRSLRIKWSRKDIVNRIEKIDDEKTREGFKKIWRYLEELERKSPDEFSIRLGTGKSPSFGLGTKTLSEGRSLFTWNLGDYRMIINFGWIAENIDNRDDIAKMIHDEFNNIGLSLPDKYINKYPSISVGEWTRHVSEIIQIIEKVIQTFIKNK